jgi:hypothetical protein
MRIRPAVINVAGKPLDILLVYILLKRIYPRIPAILSNSLNISTMPSAFIVGGSGYVGSYVGAALRREGFDVTALVRTRDAEKTHSLVTVSQSRLNAATLAVVVPLSIR